MKKFIGPRGSGRTYQICRYAIEHNCDIIVPTNRARQMMTTVLFHICGATDGQTYRDYNFDTNTVRIDKIEGLIEIRIFKAADFAVAYFGNRTKPIVIDDIDECMRVIIGACPISAVSMCTYDPVDVALRPSASTVNVTNQTQLKCRSLL